MKLPLSWLLEFINHNLSQEQLSDTLTLLGHQVESIQDDILDLEITPNRSDCLSILGLARDLGAKLNKPLKIPKVEISQINLPQKLKIDCDLKVCLRYCARIISGIKIGPSPDYIQKRLKQMGIRPTNNIVDITNFVMLEQGIPLHTFDFAKIKDGKISIRQGRTGETVTTLDGKKRHLNPDSIVIEDSEKIIDLAGIMGGENSAVDRRTTKILLQAAVFDPILIRRTSKKLSLQTESSYRYERGVDFKQTPNSLDYAARLIQKYAGGKIGKLIDIKKLSPDRLIDFVPEKISDFLGTEISYSLTIEILERLGLKIRKKNRFFQANIPSWRFSDLKIWQDLAEEVARIYGYDKLPILELPEFPLDRKESTYEKIVYIKSRLRDLGAVEVYTYSYLSEKDIRVLEFDKNKLWEIQNPISEEQKYLRPSLYPSLLKVFQKNPGNKDILVFEIGEIFPDKRELGGNLNLQLGVAGTLQNESKIKNILKIISQDLSVDLLKYTHIFRPEAKVRNFFKIRKLAIFYLINLSSILYQIARTPKIEVIFSLKKYRPISKFPPVLRDLSVVVDKKIAPSDIAETIKKVDNLIWDVELFDRFDSDKFGKDKISLSFHIIYQSFQKTLKEEEAEIIHQKVISLINHQYQAKIRSK